MVAVAAAVQDFFCGSVGGAVGCRNVGWHEGNSGHVGRAQEEQDEKNLALVWWNMETDQETRLFGLPDAHVRTLAFLFLADGPCDEANIFGRKLREKWTKR